MTKMHIHLSKLMYRCVLMYRCELMTKVHIHSSKLMYRCELEMFHVCCCKLNLSIECVYNVYNATNRRLYVHLTIKFVN